MICRKCGAVIRDGDKFCSKCGARAPSAKAEERRQNAQKRKQEKEITFRTKPAGSKGYRENFEEGENRSHALLITVTALVIMMLAVAAFALFYFMRRRSMAGGASYSSSIEIISDSGTVEQASTARGQSESGSEAVLQVQGDLPEIIRIDSSDEAKATAEGSADSDTAHAADPEASKETEQTEASDEAGMAAGGAGTEETEAPGGAGQTEAPGDAGKAGTQTETEIETGTETGTETETETETEKETEAPGPSAADVVDPARIQEILSNESSATTTEVYVYDLKHDSEAALNDCTQPMYASALITVPILYTAAHQIDQGAMTMDDQITYVTSIGGRGELTTELRDGLQFPLSFYLQTMVNYSDNNCINILIDYIGLDTINAVCQEAGYTSVNMERGLVAVDPQGLDNYVSAKDLTMMVKELYTGAFTSIGTDFMKTYFHISEGDSLPTLVGLAPDLAGATVLNQNGHGMTRYNEIAVIEDGNSLYIMTIMLHGDSGMTYSPAVTDVAQYISSVMKAPAG